MRRINEPTLGVTLLCTRDVVFALRPQIPSITIIACSQAWQGHRSTTFPVRNMNSLTPVTARYALTGLICAHCVPDHKILWFPLWEALMSLPNATRPHILSAPLPPVSATAGEVTSDGVKRSSPAWACTVPPSPPPSLSSRRFSLWSKHTSIREHWSQTQVSLQTWLYTPLFALPVTRPYTTRPKHTHKHFTLGFLH